MPRTKYTFQFPKTLPVKISSVSGNPLTKATIHTYKTRINTIALEVFYEKEITIEDKKTIIKLPIDTIELLRDNPVPVIEFINTQESNQIKRVFICAIFFILELNKDSPPNKYYDYFQTIKTN